MTTRAFLCIPILSKPCRHFNISVGLAISGGAKNRDRGMPDHTALHSLITKCAWKGGGTAMPPVLASGNNEQRRGLI